MKGALPNPKMANLGGVFNVLAGNNFVFLFLTSLILLSPITFSTASDSEVGDESLFRYDEVSGRGPKRWAKLNPHWKACENRHMQSPIDLLNHRVIAFPDLRELQRDYKLAPAFVKNRGHDIEIKWKGDAGKIRINGTDYKLVQCHWHSPSEHTFNGSRYNLELHVVHESAQGGIAVIGIVYKYGLPDPFLSKLFQHIEIIGKKEDKYLGILNPGDINFDSREYYRYIGSLTIPPCTEGVIWTIVKKVNTVSMEQVRTLRDVVHDGFEANARPTQPSAEKVVYVYNPRGRF